MVMDPVPVSVYFVRSLKLITPIVRVPSTAIVCCSVEPELKLAVAPAALGKPLDQLVRFPQVAPAVVAIQAPFDGGAKSFPAALLSSAAAVAVFLIGARPYMSSSVRSIRK